MIHRLIKLSLALPVIGLAAAIPASSHWDGNAYLGRAASVSTVQPFHHASAGVMNRTRGQRTLTPATCDLLTDPAGDAKPTVAVTSDAKNNDALDILGAKISSASGSLVATIKVANLGNGPGGQPKLSGNSEAWFLDFTTSDSPDAYQFVGLVYGTEVVPVDNTGKPWQAFTGSDTTTPGAADNVHSFTSYKATASESATDGTIVLRLSLGDGVVLTNITVDTIELDGGDAILLTDGTTFTETPVDIAHAKKSYTVGQTTC